MNKNNNRMNSFQTKPANVKNEIIMEFPSLCNHIPKEKTELNYSNAINIPYKKKETVIILNDLELAELEIARLKEEKQIYNMKAVNGFQILIDRWEQYQETFIETNGQDTWDKMYENPTEPYIDEYHSEVEDNDSSDYDSDESI
jgi:hypothetical protein